MKNCFIAALAVAGLVVLCAGCASGPEAGKSAAQGQSGAQQEGQVVKLTQEQMSEVMREFSGISREHAAQVWQAKNAADEAADLLKAYLKLRIRGEQTTPEMFELTVKAHKGARRLIEPVCKLYPHNAALNDTANVVTQGLRCLAEQKRMAGE